MKQKVKYCILLVFICSTSVYSQEIEFDKYTHNFGLVANMEYPPAVFNFTNKSTEKTAVLMIQKSPDVLVKFKRNFVLPGETGRIEVKYNTNTLGPFSENLEVIFSSLDQPLTLTISGENTTVLNCFPNPENQLLRWVYVIDRETKTPVPRAHLELIYNKQQDLSFTVDQQGRSQQEMPIGLYDTKITARNYLPYDSSVFVRKSQPYVYFEMQPVSKEISPPPDPEPVLVFEETVVSPPEPENPNELSRLEYAENNVVLLVDVSLSMRSGHKLDLLKESIKNLVSVLRDIDRVTLISYASLSTVHCAGIPGNQNAYLSAIIDSLTPYGITNGVKGLETAYQLASDYYVPHGNNQVILATDGKFTGSSGSEGVYESMIQKQVQKNILLSIIGFGIDAEAIALMQKMAEAGQGGYIHVDRDNNASTTLIDEIKEKSKK